METVAEHDPHLAHHFDTPEQQFTSGKLGMWIFLATEILFFGGLFCAYAVYRSSHPEIFVAGHQVLDKTLGGINTMVLIGSSLSMALAVRFAQLGQKRALITALVVTLVAACGFLGIKAIEYEAKWKHGLLWGTHFHPHTEQVEHDLDHPAEESSTEQGHAKDVAEDGDSADRSAIARSAQGPSGLAATKQDAEQAGGDHHAAEDLPPNVQIFFGIYFAMTGLHGLHVIIGMGLMLWLIVRASRGEFGRGYFAPVDFVGLYWHLVDLIWIFLFPLLYLIE